MVALIFLVTTYYWTDCKNRNIIKLFKRPMTIGLILALGIPLLMGSIHYFYSSEIGFVVKYGLFFTFSLSLFGFNLYNYRTTKGSAVAESKEFFNLRKRPLVKPLPPNKERIKQQLVNHFIKPELANLEMIKKENKNEYKKSLGKIKDEEERIKDRLEDLQEKEEEVDKKIEVLTNKEERIKLEKDEVKFNLSEVKRELSTIEKDKDKIELAKLKAEKDRERMKKKISNLLVFEEELEKEKGEFKKARGQADKILKLKKKIDEKIKEYNSKLKVFVQ